VLYTSDGGEHWKRAGEGGTTLLMLGIAMNTPTSGCVAGIGVLTIAGMEYTTNGTVFMGSKEFELESESQSVEGIVGNAQGYGVTGQFGTGKDAKNGVAISTNGGETFSMIDCGLNFTYLTRYGSFPSPTTWYLSAGTWPGTSEQRERGRVEGFRQLTERIALYPNQGTTKSFKPVFSLEAGTKKPRDPQDNNGFFAAITKTTDGGKTWTQVYNNINNFYPNAISCPTTTDCWFVAESGGGSDQPGANIIATNDGGKTWTTQWTSSNPNYSLMAISMMSTTEGWAAGGVLDANFDGEWLYTSNGGQTWTATTIHGVYGNDLSFVSTGANSYVGWATAFTEQSLSSVVQYK